MNKADFKTFLKTFLPMKRVSKAVIIYEVMDVCTTMGGFSLFPNLMETNPLPGVMGGMLQIILIKMLATFLIVYILESVRSWPKFVYIVPMIAGIPVVWNTLVILAEFFAKA
jgi:hypothetical protein